MATASDVMTDTNFVRTLIETIKSLTAEVADLRAQILGRMVYDEAGKGLLPEWVLCSDCGKLDRDRLCHPRNDDLVCRCRG